MTDDYSGLAISDTTSDIGLVRNGNSADNRLGGTNLRDVFFGAEGNDILGGYDAFDTYTFEVGDGAIRIVGWSRLSDETKAAWTIEYFFLPRSEPAPERLSSIELLLTNRPLLIFLLVIGIFSLARAFLKQS